MKIRKKVKSILLILWKMKWFHLLILSGKIKSVEKLGFSIEYIKELLHTKNSELKDSVVEYHYDSSTDRTSKVVNEKMIILPYNPSVVKKIKPNSKYKINI